MLLHREDIFSVLTVYRVLILSTLEPKVALMRLINWTQEPDKKQTLNAQRKITQGRIYLRNVSLRVTEQGFKNLVTACSLLVRLCPNFCSKRKSTKSRGAAEEPSETGDTACVENQLTKSAFIVQGTF